MSFAQLFDALRFGLIMQHTVQFSINTWDISNKYYYNIKIIKQTRIFFAREKLFIPCKPHRARAQPRSDLGEQWLWALKTKKQTKHFSILPTIGWLNNWLNCNCHNIFRRPTTAIWAKKASPFKEGEKTTRTTMTIGGDGETKSDSSRFFLPARTKRLIPETGVRKNCFKTPTYPTLQIL